jgi:negative regulator of flagellin synthesis FlgM
MEIRNSSEALKAFLGVSPSESMKSKGARCPEVQEGSSLLAGDEARLSGVGAAIQGAADRDSVRLDKVAAVQQALAAGTYSIPASKVADKVIETMLSTAVEPKP